MNPPTWLESWLSQNYMILGHCPALQGSDIYSALVRSVRGGFSERPAGGSRWRGQAGRGSRSGCGRGTRQSWLALAAASLPDQEIDQPYPRVEMFSKHPLVVRIRAIELDRAALDRQAQRLALRYGLGAFQELLAP